MDSLLVTLSFFTRASSHIDLSSATILLLYSLTTSPYSSPHTSSQFTPLPIRFLTAFDSPPSSTDSFPSSSNNSSSFPLYMPCSSPQMVSCYQSTLAYILVLIRLAHLEGQGLQGLHQIFHFGVHFIVSFSDKNILGGLYWCQRFFSRDCWEAHHHWILWEWNSSWD